MAWKLKHEGTDLFVIPGVLQPSLRDVGALIARGTETTHVAALRVDALRQRVAWVGHHTLQ